MEQQDHDQTFRVVRNDEEQYSIWTTERPVPGGWEAVGVEGARDHCLSWIEANWTDMRPASLRRRDASVLGGAG